MSTQHVRKVGIGLSRRFTRLQMKKNYSRGAVNYRKIGVFHFPPFEIFRGYVVGSLLTRDELTSPSSAVPPQTLSSKPSRNIKVSQPLKPFSLILTTAVVLVSLTFRQQHSYASFTILYHQLWGNLNVFNVQA